MGNDINQAATKNQINQLKLSPLSFESQEADIIKNKKTVTKAKDNTRRAIHKKNTSPYYKVYQLNSLPHSSYSYSNNSQTTKHQDKTNKCF